MHRFNTAYITYYNLRHHRSGHLYQGRYKAILVEADEYLLELSRYIHLNPVRLKKYRETSLEEKSKILKDYIWSSLPGYLKIKSREDFARYDAVLGYMGGDDKKGRIRYRGFVLGGLSRKLRQVLIELAYQLNFRKKSLQKLGEELGGIGGDSVAHAHQRIQDKM